MISTRMFFSRAELYLTLNSVQSFRIRPCLQDKVPNALLLILILLKQLPSLPLRGIVAIIVERSLSLYLKPAGQPGQRQALRVYNN